MSTRRLGAAAIIVAGLLAGTACQAGGDDAAFAPDADGFLELACSIERHQRDLSAAKIAADDAVERQLAYTASSALLESGNRDRDSDRQRLSKALRSAIDQGDGPAFDKARGDIDDYCEDDDLSVEPDGLADIACSIAETLSPGPGPELLLAVDLAGLAAAEDDEYAKLAAAGGQMVVNPDDPMDVSYPDQAAIANFQQTCP